MGRGRKKGISKTFESRPTGQGVTSGLLLSFFFCCLTLALDLLLSKSLLCVAYYGATIYVSPICVEYCSAQL